MPHSPMDSPDGCTDGTKERRHGRECRSKDFEIGCPEGAMERSHGRKPVVRNGAKFCFRPGRSKTRLGEGDGSLWRRGAAICVVMTGAAATPMAFVGCGREPPPSYEQRLADTRKPALHAVRKERLRELMADMNRLAMERLPQEMDVSSQRARDARELAAVAEALADDAKAIPAVLADVRMSEEDRRVFISYADKLADEAVDLARLARAASLRNAQAKMDEMVTTCNACHSAFRILPRVER